jgi:hypothetical protein
MSTPLGNSNLDKRVDRFLSRRIDFDQPLMSAQLELLTRFLVDVRRTQDGKNLFLVGSGIGPVTTAPLLRTVLTIFSVDLSTKL